MKRFTMKWKELPTDTTIMGLILHVPKKWRLLQGIPQSKMLIFSGWYKGLWLKTNEQSSRIYPLTLDSWKDIEDFYIEVPPHVHLAAKLIKITKHKEKVK